MTPTPTILDSPFDAAFLDAQRQELVGRRASYLTDLDELSASARDLADGRGAAETTDEDGFGEVDTVTVEREQLLVVAAKLRTRIDDIDRALAGMDAGSYGICEGCHQPIAVARLEALPEATLCVGCKTGASLRRR